MLESVVGRGIIATFELTFPSTLANGAKIIWMTISRVLLILVVYLAVAASARAEDRPQKTGLVHDQQFWSHWSDGNAELNGYDFIVPRYGSLRHGTSVAIFVKEPFLIDLRVKADQADGSGIFEVMKLNLMHDFPTGIYDYNVMISTFAAMESFGSQRSGEIAKVSFSAQEWCGHTYSQLLFRADGVEETLHSYFASEADQLGTHPARASAVSEDAVLLWARGMTLPLVTPGASVETDVMTSTMRSRLLHKPMGWRKAKFTRSAETKETTVPAGTFKTRRATVAVDGGLQWEIDVEEKFPHRVIRWQTNDGESASLVGSARLPYWKMNGPGFEQELTKLGLTPRERRTP